MKGLRDRSHARPPGALWLGAPLVLAACVAAEAAPPVCDAAERAPVQARLGRLVRDGVARLAQSTRHVIAPSHAVFVLFALDRLSAVPGLCSFAPSEPSEPVQCRAAEHRAFPLDPGRTSSPTAAP